MNVISKLDNAEKELHDKDYSNSAIKRINQNRKEEKSIKKDIVYVNILLNTILRMIKI